MSAANDNIGIDYQLAVAPLISKLQMAVAFGDSVTLDPIACKGLAAVLGDMSMKMDLTAALMRELKHVS